MCGAAHGPQHDDPAAAAVCDRYQQFEPTSLPRLRRELDERERELLWLVALGLGPEALARRSGVDPSAVRDQLGRLAARLMTLGAKPA